MPLLGTKLRAPTARRVLVPRERLLERLPQDPTMMPRLLLISAPAGFGKTTLLGQWLAAPTAASGPGQAALALRVAWLSLDPADAEPRTFFTHLVAALQSVGPACRRCGGGAAGH
jgi:LuxR family transcriptional regulator, maltose regulon positive regulatory protein